MESGFEIRTSCMADYKVSDLPKAQYLLLMTSTFGDGDAPFQLRPGPVDLDGRDVEPDNLPWGDRRREPHRDRSGAAPALS